MQTFADLPLGINQAISAILSRQENSNWILNAVKLHDRYMQRAINGRYINNSSDALSYLGLRAPATYAQVFGALEQVKEMIPSWSPKSILDIGSGPGTAVWATLNTWPSIINAKCVDQNKDLLLLGEEIKQKAKLTTNILWEQKDASDISNTDNKFDLIIIANVLNELDKSKQQELLKKAFNLCTGTMIIIEPGTTIGINTIQQVIKEFTNKTYLIAPYIDNSLVIDSTNWIHFSKRFIRPEFQKRIKQLLQHEKTQITSDWEDTKYAYVAFSKIYPEKKIDGRCIGSIKKQKGFIEVPLLLKTSIQLVKILKRDKLEYNFAKNLKWGEAISDINSLVKNS